MGGYVPGAGVEPASTIVDNILSVARIPIPPPGQYISTEAWAGIEPAHGGFANRSVTTSPPRHFRYYERFRQYAVYSFHLDLSRNQTMECVVGEYHF